MGVKYYRDVQIASPREIWTATTTSEIQFVDGDNGSNGNAGWSPKKAVASITQAVTNVTGKAAAVIYVRPKANTTDSNQSYYVDNVTIPITVPGLSIIGAGSNPSRPYFGVDIKANTSTSVLFDVLASGVTLEGMRLAGTGQNATDGIAIVRAINYGTSSGSPYGLCIRGCRLDNARTGGAINMDSPVGVLIEDCSFHDCAVGITSNQGQMSSAAFGPRIENCDFGGAAASRDMDIYISQAGKGNTTGGDHYLIYRCMFMDDLPAKGDNNRFIKIANADTGMIAYCGFSTSPGANHIDTYGAAGNQCVIPTTWKMVGCFGGGDADPIHPAEA
jgi:hypothetical protein